MVSTVKKRTPVIIMQGGKGIDLRWSGEKRLFHLHCLLKIEKERAGDGTSKCVCPREQPVLSGKQKHPECSGAEGRSSAWR